MTLVIKSTFIAIYKILSMNNYMFEEKFMLM